MEPAVTAMETEGATAELTVMVIALEVAVVGLAHDELDVITQVMTSLFASEDEV